MKICKRVRVICEDFEPGALTPSLERRLARGLEVRPCRGGVSYKGCVWSSAAQLNAYLLTTAAAILSTTIQSGGESTATGRYLHDKGHFLRHAASAVYKHRAKLWPGASV